MQTPSFLVSLEMFGYKDKYLHLLIQSIFNILRKNTAKSILAGHIQSCGLELTNVVWQ